MQSHSKIPAKLRAKKVNFLFHQLGKQQCATSVHHRMKFTITQIPIEMCGFLEYLPNYGTIFIFDLGY